MSHMPTRPERTTPGAPQEGFSLAMRPISPRISDLSTTNCRRKAKFSRISSSRDWAIRCRMRRRIDTIAMSILSMMANFRLDGETNQVTEITEVPNFGKLQGSKSLPVVPIGGIILNGSEISDGFDQPFGKSRMLDLLESSALTIDP